MRLRSAMKQTGAIATSILSLLVLQAPLYAQRSGPAARGGSLALERAGERPARAAVAPPESYKGILRELGLDFEKLNTEYSESRRAGRPQGFKNIVLAHLVAREVSPGGRGGDAVRVLKFLEEGGSLREAVARAFNLSPAEARRLTRAAERRFDQARRGPH